jgi:hypothetical protein
MGHSELAFLKLRHKIKFRDAKQILYLERVANLNWNVEIVLECREADKAARLDSCKLR